MKKGAAYFTLIEVMLSVAIFAFAAVGFAVALNDVLGINVEMMRTSQRRQAVESLAARILAASNNLQDRSKQWQTEAKYKTTAVTPEEGLEITFKNIKITPKIRVLTKRPRI